VDYLLREDAPFSGELWNSIDEMVVRVARDQLIARRFIHILGPLGAGLKLLII